MHLQAKKRIPGEYAKPGRGDHTYSIPKEKINKFFRDNYAIFYNWVIQYPQKWIEPSHPIPFLNPGDTIKVFIIDKVKPLPNHRSQSFAQGISHCLLQPIIQDLTNKKDVAKSKQSKSNYNCGIKVLSQYEEQYRSGVMPSPLTLPLVRLPPEKSSLTAEECGKPNTGKLSYDAPGELKTSSLSIFLTHHQARNIPRTSTTS